MLLLDTSKKHFVDYFTGEMGVERAKGLVEKVDKWAAGKGWMLMYEDEAVVMGAQGGA